MVGDWATLDREVLVSILGVGFGWCASQLYGLRALRSQRRATKKAELRAQEKEIELTEAVERTMRGDPKIDAKKMIILLTCVRCPTCNTSSCIKRGARCYGHQGECPDWEVHYHTKCTHCGVDWIECTPERTINQQRREEEKAKG